MRPRVTATLSGAWHGVSCATLIPPPPPRNCLDLTAGSEPDSVGHDDASGGAQSEDATAEAVDGLGPISIPLR